MPSSGSIQTALLPLPPAHGLTRKPSPVPGASTSKKLTRAPCFPSPSPIGEQSAAGANAGAPTPATAPWRLESMARSAGCAGCVCWLRPGAGLTTWTRSAARQLSWETQASAGLACEETRDPSTRRHLTTAVPVPLGGSCTAPEDVGGAPVGGMATGDKTAGLGSTRPAAAAEAAVGGEMGGDGSCGRAVAAAAASRRMSPVEARRVDVRRKIRCREASAASAASSAASASGPGGEPSLPPLGRSGGASWRKTSSAGVFSSG